MKSFVPLAEVLLVLILFFGIVTFDAALQMTDSILCRGTGWQRAVAKICFDEKPLSLAGYKGQKVLLTHIDVISAEALAFGER
ncbi:hypothetical protein [Planctomyces sp. SH-PL14]|jgi:hypothetical protein|uniref:hypothetical protein n=1 Tax=Planctomyces sp. SH-PL14 TaxID=1632864 RepID=UPI00078DE461|nr:hypothetical protein [Planctomyces sp. SH-PL14]AMV19438.1 hypothetical protein VT03_16210 [Planctomyces sp. SH-PL14]